MSPSRPRYLQDFMNEVKIGEGKIGLPVSKTATDTGSMMKKECEERLKIILKIFSPQMAFMIGAML